MQQIILAFSLLFALLVVLFIIERRRTTRLRRRCGQLLESLTAVRMAHACITDNCNFYQYRLADFASRTFNIPYPCYEGKGDDDEARMKPGDIVTFSLKDGGEVLTGEIEANIDDEGNMLPRCPVCVHEPEKDIIHQLDRISDIRLEKRPDNFSETFNNLNGDGDEI